MITIAWIGSRVAMNERRHVEEQALQMVHDFAQQVDGELTSLTRALQTLSLSPMLDDRNHQRFRELAVAVASANDASIALREASGLHIVNTLLPFGTQPMPSTSDPVLRRADERALATLQSVASDLYIGATGKRPYVSVVQPVVRDGEAKALLSLAITPERLQHKLNLGALAAQGWLASILGADGRVIARTRDPEQFVGRPATPAMLQALSEQPTGTLRSRTLDGADVFTAYETLPGGWALVVSVPVAVLEAPVRQLALVLALVSGLILATTAGGAWAYGRLLGAELSTLAENATRLGDRLPPKPTRHMISEAEVAQRALEHAGAKAELVLRELDHRVKNTLGIIVSLVSRGVSDQRQRSTLIGRISALAHAHEALSREHWDGVLLASLVETICTAQQVPVALDGPALALAPRTVTCLSQVLQELCSNAHRHGELGTGGGVELRCEVAGADVVLTWKEPPRDAGAGQPYKPGFGLTLVDLCLVRQLNGTVKVGPEEGRWTVTMRFPLESSLGVAAWQAGAARPTPVADAAA
jgi:two-component sensor histidine kinase